MSDCKDLRKKLRAIELELAWDAADALEAQVKEIAGLEYEAKLFDEALQIANARIAELEAENAELEAVFKAQWDAEQRAIKDWQEKTGKAMTWPDHAKMVEWLLDELEAARAAMEGEKG